LVWERLKVAIEPSAGVGVPVAKSAKFHQKYPRLSGIENVGIILCGGNVDILKMSALMKDLCL
jgi:threonine dehydratase